ncbi:archaeosortase A [Natronococcus sp.]|uniref:archaeosortase A n=1 Tax=Natronococcus sp. TaxID=35747 RepID=UPI0025DFC354|nr:archaeosortase A [Natronococcus sp.]
MSSPSAPSADALGALASGETIASTLQGTLPIDALGWIAIAAFGLALLTRWSDVAVPARPIAGVAWLLFGTYWLTMVPYYYYDAQSPLQTVLALAALPLCVYTGYLLWNGRESLFVLTKAVALMGLIYLPAETIPIVRQWLIETTAVQTHYGMELLGHSPGINEGANGYESRFNFDSEETATGRTTYIVLACTGLGSMAIFGGLIAAVTAPLRRKLTAFALAIGVIWLLNLVRNVFIGLATPHGWFQQDLVVSLVTTYMGAEETRVSYLVAHNYISQLLAVVALIGVTYLVVKILPEVLEPLEEVLFVLTGTEYDLETALNPDVRTDGGSRDP